MSFDTIVVSLPGTWDPGLPVAASRAGAVGVLDLTYLSDTEQLRHATEQLQQNGHGETGYLVHARLDACEALLAELIQSDNLVILLPDSDQNPTDVVEFWRQQGNRVGLVATSLEEAEMGVTAGVDFIIGKGSETGGKTGREGSFVLMQRLLRKIELPVYVWGGISWNTALACKIAGAAGVVLDWQLALLRESPLSDDLSRRLQKMDGSETSTLALSDQVDWRFLTTPNMTILPALEAEIERQGTQPSFDFNRWAQLVEARFKESNARDRLIALGQDAVFAADWKEHAQSVGRALMRFRDYLSNQAEKIIDYPSLSENSPLAQLHNTRYPLVQGPMTRVSDVAGFCEAVEQGGGLPFIALAMMSGAGSHETLKQTFRQMGSRPWGVGVLGFNDPELYKAQMAAVEEFRPPYAIISGGRPDQAARLESLGTLTYLHAPSPAILEIYLQEGARHFVFEGYECGGHVGPRASFVLWESMIKVLLDSGLPKVEMEKVSVLFAGGIHDAVSAAMVSALALPLAERGVKVGALMGTAYIFTREVVETGAIIDKFQQVALQTEYSVVAETGPGHAIRCAPTDFYHEFAAEKNKLRQSGLDGEAVRQELDKRNIGRLRIASKGVQRVTNEQTRQRELAVVDDAIQQQEGIYMLGQVAALNNQVFSIAELHAQVCDGAQDILNQSAKHASVVDEKIPEAPPPLDIAIVGISCLLPGGANDVSSYWDNIIHARDSIDEVPADRFDYQYWFDEDRDAQDKIYSKWGGFIEDIPFDPIKYGIPPNSLTSIEPMQLIALELIDQALKDAGYKDSNPYKERTGVILGVGGGASELGSNYIVRSALPRFFESPEPELLSELPEWTEDSFAGILLNVVAGRAANRFDFGGVNFTVDAACASSLASLYLACRELSTGTADMMIAGGCDTTQNPFGYLCFSKTGALSPSGRSRTFDANSDGIVTSEGHAAIILKRLEDAERDGDKIYAVLKGVAGGSDGRQKGLTAPREDGQLRTLQRAYAQARYSPASVGLFEAHGTGTVVGDRTESTALTSLLNENDTPHKSVAIGSVKSMIGHTKCTAGIAGLIKIALSLRHQVLPPTLHVKEPNTLGGLNNGPLYVNSELRPWIKGPHPRRASVSAFGFGGTNFHATLEEYQATVSVKDQLALPRNLPAELFVFVADSGEALARRISLFAQSVNAVIANDVDIDLADLAYTWHQQTVRNHGNQRASLVAESLADLPGQLDALESLVSIGEASEENGIFYTPEPLGSDTPIAFIFPGQGSQKPNMMRDLVVVFKEILDSYELADQLLPDAYAGESLSAKIFPPPMFSDEERKNAFESLKITDVAQPALGVSSVAMLHMLKSFGLDPSMVAGHSYGELVALHAAGAIDEASLYRLSWRRGDAIMQMTRQSGDLDLGGMLAVAADETVVKPLLSGLEGCWLANLNSPRQTVISGNEAGLAAVAKRIEEAGLSQVALPVACAFHSPIMQPASETFAGVLDELEFATAELAVYSNVSAKAYPGDDPAQYRQTLTQQLIQPVRFEEEIKEMYKDGARVFVEVGPGMVLSKLTGQILADQPHVAIATNTDSSNDVAALLSALGRLIAHGVAVTAERLYTGRELEILDLAGLARQAKESAPAHTWLLNGSYIRPVKQVPRHDQPRFKLSSSAEGDPEVGQQSGSGQAAIPAVSATPAVPTAAAPPAAPAAPGISVPIDDQRAIAFMRFQETMRQFLENQQEVMQAYLGSRSAQGADEDSPPVADTISPVPLANRNNQPEKQETRVDAEPAPDAPAAEVTSITGAAPAVSVDLSETLKDIIAERTGYPPEMLDSEANLEADLGIDSIKRVEIIAAFRRAVLPEMQEPTQAFIDRMAEVRSMQDILDVIGDFVAVTESAADAAAPAAEVTPITAAAPAISVDLGETLKDIIAERTGYPPEMLDPEANLEADLGIDSIKRVEIIAAFRRAILPEMQEPTQAFIDRMAEVRSIQDILDVIGDFVAVTEPAVAPTAEVTPITEAAPAISVDLGETLKDIIAERTGYPPEMLDPEANLEADLGIDSIKRVEIIAAFRRAILPEMQEPTQAFIDRMAEVRSMQDILDVIGDFVASGNALDGADKSADSASVSPIDAKKTDSNRDECPRCVVRPIPVELAAGDDWPVPSGTILVTDDGSELSETLIETLTTRGGVCVRLNERDLISSASASVAVENARNQYGSIAALIHLAGMQKAPEFPAIDVSTWDQFVHAEVNGLLYLLQALATELDNSEGAGVSVLCGTRGGGDFDDAGNVECQQPWRGGIAGLIKVAAKEWPNNHFHVVDFAQTPSVAQILSELASCDFIEVGYRRNSRFALLPVREELPTGNTDAVSALGADDVVLITGGARGITAEVAKLVAAKSKATLVLLGRSALPADEAEVTRKQDDPVELRRVLIDKARRQGADVSPRDIELEIGRILANREILSTLDAITATGARVEYVSCDVSNTNAFGTTVKDVKRRLGAITAVIHGAGIIEDRYIVDKTAESFDRVLQTKLNPVLTLINGLDLQQLKLLMLFSSTAGFFGNPGQGDYASANEILNRIARRMQDLLPAKVVAMNWGPWTGAGMVKEEVQRQFEARGVGMVTVDGGTRVACEEMHSAGDDPVRVLVGPGSWARINPGSQRLLADTPLLQGQSVYRLDNGDILAQVVLDEENQTYLRDHKINQKPVLPLAFAMELMSETVALAAPDWVVTRLDNFRLFKGVEISAGYREILVKAEPRSESATDAQWQVRVLDPLDETRPFYQATVTLAASAPEIPSLQEFEPVKGEFPQAVNEAYQNWLFHGPSFQAVNAIQGFNNLGIDASLQPTTAGMNQFINSGRGWILNPLVLDCVPQLAILWSRARFDSTPLPNAVSRYSCYAPIGDEPLDVYVRMAPSTSEQTYQAEALFVRDGKVLGKLEGLEGAGSADLNRVANA